MAVFKGPREVCSHMGVYEPRGTPHSPRYYIVPLKEPQKGYPKGYNQGTLFVGIKGEALFWDMP